MTQVLQHEILYRSETTLIHKTYDQRLDRYGMLREQGGRYMYADTTYRHIFAFEEERAAAITDDNKFVWIDIELNESPMDTLDKVIWELARVNNSICSCSGKLTEFNCELCDDSGVIFNELNWRRIDSKGSRMLYEYDSEYSTYSIIITPSAMFNSINANDVWEETELERNIRLFIDNHREQLLVMPLFLNVIITGRDSRFAGVRLIPCSISVELINNLPPDATQKNSYFFNYSTFISRKH